MAQRRFETVVHMLVDAAEKTPEQEALVCEGERLNYRAFLNCVSGFSKELDQLGMKNERVALVMGNSIDMCIAMFTIHMSGGQVAPLNPTYTEYELRPMLQDAEVKMIIYDAVNRETVEKLIEELNVPEHLFIGAGEGRRLTEWADSELIAPAGTLPRGDDLAMLQFTGGTTGRAKGANLSHSAISSNIDQAERMQAPELDCERVLCVMPLFHCYAWSVCLYNMVNCRGTSVIVPRYQPDQLLDLFARERISIFAGSPTLFTGLMSFPGFEDTDFSTLKHSNSGSAPLPVELLEKWEKTTGTPVFEGYGQTEASPVISFNPADRQRKSGSVGVPLPDTSIEIVSIENGQDILPAGEQGEIRLRGPQVMNDYRNREEETAEALRDGWLYTGDIGYFDEDGYLFITARKKEMLLVSGFNVFPREIEEVLFLHPDIKEAAVVGKKDGYRGELPVAFIVGNSTEASKLDGIVEHGEIKLAKYKIPDEFRFVDALPKTAVGKVDKVALTAMANE